MVAEQIIYFRTFPELSSVGVSALRGNRSEFSAGIEHGLLLRAWRKPSSS